MSAASLRSAGLYSVFRSRVSQPICLSMQGGLNDATGFRSERSVPGLGLFQRLFILRGVCRRDGFVGLEGCGGARLFH